MTCAKSMGSQETKGVLIRLVLALVYRRTRVKLVSMSETCFRKHLLQFIKEQLEFMCFHSRGRGLIFYVNQPPEGNQGAFASLLGNTPLSAAKKHTDSHSRPHQSNNSRKTAPPSFQLSCFYNHSIHV